MFPRNKNRNEGTFATTTFYETALLSPSEFNLVPLPSRKFPGHLRRTTSRCTSESRIWLVTVIGSEKKHIKIKTRKQNFHGIVPGLWGEFCLCVFPP